VNNREFNYGEYAAMKIQTGLNSYKISPKEWIYHQAKGGKQ